MTALAVYNYCVVCPSCAQEMQKTPLDADLWYCVNHECKLSSTQFRVRHAPSSQVELLEEPDQEPIHA